MKISKKEATVVLRGTCEDCGKRTQQTVAKKNAGVVLGLVCRACAKRYKAQPEQDAYYGDPVRIAAAIAAGMKANSHLGDLKIDETPLLPAIREMQAAGFVFTPENVKLICWPEGDSTLRSVAGYQKLGDLLNAYYE